MSEESSSNPMTSARVEPMDVGAPSNAGVSAEGEANTGLNNLAISDSGEGHGASATARESRDSEEQDSVPAAEAPSGEVGAGGSGGDDAANADADNRPSNSSPSDATSSTDSSDPDEIFDDDDDDSPTSPTDPTELIMQAVNHKEEGNAHFKSGDLTKASRSYRRGTSVLKNLNKNNTGDEQVKSLLLSLQTNLSMVCYKQNKFKMSRDVATKALAVDGTNVKALYRRAAANRKMGDLDAARADLKEALRHDPNNATVKREFVSVKKELDTQKSKEKERLQKAFGSQKKGAGSFLYDDKEREEKRKAAAKKAKREAEVEMLKKRKAEWEDECVRRMSNGEDAISFEDWEKEWKKKEEEEEKARKKAKKEEEERRKAERKKARAAAKEAQRSFSSDDEEDEEILKDVSKFRGYKKTTDGRTTSYFTREQTAEEKALIGDITPQRLETTGTAGGAASIPAASAIPTPESASPTAAAAAGPTASAWNQAGTWEERDTTDWCSQRLRSRLDATTATSSMYTAKVTSVKDMTGHASVALTGGKKRYIFDYHAKISYDVVDEGDDVVASGKLHLPDISSTGVANHEDLEVDVKGWKTVPPAETVKEVTECRGLLVGEIRRSVLNFVEDFNAHY